MAEGNAKEIIKLYWQTQNVRLKLIWICFGLILALHVTSKVCELICPSSCLHWLAVTFVISFFLGMWMGLFLCFDESFNIVNHENSVQWTKPLALSIQNLYLPSGNYNTQGKEKQSVDENSFLQLKNEIQGFEELIMQDFINVWYDRYICGEVIFPENVNSLMNDVITELLERIRNIDQKALLLHTLQEITKHLTILEKSRHNLKKLRNTSQDKSQHFLVACYETFSVLHPAATSNDSELDYLRSVFGALLNNFLPKNVRICEPLVHLVREIICQAVLQRAIELICEPEFINELIVMLADYVTSSKVLDSQKEQSSITVSVPTSQTQHEYRTEIDRPAVSKTSGETLEKDKNTVEALQEGCQKQKFTNKQMSEYALKMLVPYGIDCDQVAEKMLKIQNASDEHNITLEEKINADSKRESSHSSTSFNLEHRPKCQFLLSTDEGNISDVTSDENGLEQSPLPEEISDPITASNLTKAQTFSSFSFFKPVPLPKRAKSPALSNLSRSVDSIVDCEATPGELVTEPAKKKGHSRNSSYPTIIPSDDDFPGNEESTESLNIPGSQDTIEHSVSMPALRKTVDGEEEENFCISNLSIMSTEQMQEYNSKKTYVLYVVEFQVHAPGSLEEEDAEAIELQVKRRYREFLTLHWKLDQRQELKKVLKNVKSVPKRFALPIMKKDTAAIKQRQISLERYLKQLLDIPAIHTSPEMVEFLALKGNANIAFVQAATSYAPKFDKIIRRSLSEVKQGLKNLAPFPSAKPDVNNSSVVPAEKSSNSGRIVSEWGEEDQPVTADQPLRICSVEQPESLGSAMHVMPFVIEEALSGLELMIDSLPENTLDPVHRDSSQMSSQMSSANQCKSQSYKTEGNIPCQQDSPELPLFSSVMDIIGILQRDPEHWIFEENVSVVMKKLAGDYVQRYIYREVSVLLAPKSWALYLSLIREALWPNGELYQSSGEVLSASEQMELFKKAENVLLSSYPGILNILVGEDNMKDAISQLFESVQNKQLNKHLIYTFIDHLLELALPEMKDTKFMDVLLGQ